MTRKRAAAQPVAAPTSIQPPGAAPVQREATPEERAQIQAQAQRQRAEVAVLKQRFAETDVAMTIAEAERDQLIQQQQFLHQKIATLEAELEALKNPPKAETPAKAETPSKAQES